MSTTYRTNIEEYQATYTTTFQLLRRVGLRLTIKDSKIVRTFWSIFFWVKFISLNIDAFLEFAYVVKVGSGGSFDDAVAVFTMTPCFGFVIIGLTKSYKIAVCQPKCEQLNKELEDMWPSGDMSKEEYDIVRKNLKKIKIVTVGYHWCNNALILTFLSPPFIAIVKRWLGYDIPLALPLFYWLPFDPLQRGNYEFMLFIQTWDACIAVWYCYGGDMLYCIFINHITTHLDLMSLRIRNLIHVPVDRQLLRDYPLGKTDQSIKNKCRLMSAETKEDYFVKELRSILRTHKKLIRFSETTEELFSFSLLVSFSYSSVIICFCGFCCVIVEKWNEFVYKSFLLTVISQTWLFCWYGNRLYESVIKTSWSYFTLLLHFYKHQRR